MDYYQISSVTAQSSGYCTEVQDRGERSHSAMVEQRIDNRAHDIDHDARESSYILVVRVGCIEGGIMASLWCRSSLEISSSCGSFQFRMPWYLRAFPIAIHDPPLHQSCFEYVLNQLLVQFELTRAYQMDGQIERAVELLEYVVRSEIDL